MQEEDCLNIIYDDTEVHKQMLEHEEEEKLLKKFREITHRWYVRALNKVKLEDGGFSMITWAILGLNCLGNA